MARASKFTRIRAAVKDAADVPITAVGTASQTANLYEAQDSGGVVQWRVPPDGEGVERYAEVTITTGQLLALRATPKTLVAAPGAGKILEFVSAVLILDYNTVAYTETADNFQVKYVDGSGVAASQTIETTGWIDQVADTITNALPKINVIGTPAQLSNTALVLHNTGDGEIEAGNSPVLVKVIYRVHKTGL